MCVEHNKPPASVQGTAALQFPLEAHIMSSAAVLVQQINSLHAG